MDAIFTRRSVRQFTTQPIEDAKIDKILRAAMQAPSACNQQPWEFIVVRGKTKLAALSQYNPYAACLKGADVGIVVLGNTERMRSPSHWEQDLGAATQNLMIEAADLGLGTVWFGTAPDEQRMAYVSKFFNLSENLLPYSVIAVGYPLDENANHFVDRFDANRIKYVTE